MKLVVAVLLLALLPVASLAQTIRYEGQPIPYTLYGQGNGCVASNALYTASTTGLFVMEEGVLCETDVMDGSTMYTKNVLTTCRGTDEGMPDAIYWDVYSCTTDDCSDCEETPEANMYLNWTSFTAPNPNVDTCMQWTVNAADEEQLAGDFPEFANITEGYELIDPGTSEEDVKAFWGIYIDNSCIADDAAYYGPHGEDTGDTSSGIRGMPGAFMALGTAAFAAIAGNYMY
jgi:hypothetical protein